MFPWSSTRISYRPGTLHVGLRYDIQCHDVDEYLVYLFDGMQTERPLELLEVVTIDGDLPLEFLFHVSFAKLTNWFTNSKDFGQNLSILPKIPCINPLFYELVEFLHSLHLDFVRHVNIGLHGLVVAVASPFHDDLR